MAGTWKRERSERRALRAQRPLLDLGAQRATMLRDGREISVFIERLGVGDEFVVRPGEKIATDGTVIAGSSAVDASRRAGEPVPPTSARATP